MEASTLGERIGAGKEAEVFAFGFDVVKLYPLGNDKAAAFREGATLPSSRRSACRRRVPSL